MTLLNRCRPHSSQRSRADSIIMSREAFITGAALCCAVLWGCPAKTPPPAAPQGEPPPSTARQDATPSPGEGAAVDRDAGSAAPGDLQDVGDPVLGQVGELVTVRMSEYDRALKRFAIFAPDESARALPAEMIKSPRFQQRTVLNLLELKLTRMLASQKGVTVGEAELEASLSGEARLARFVPVEGREALLAEFGLVVADLDEILRDRVLAARLPEVLVQPLESEALWEAWKKREERVEIAFVAVPNTPSSEAISAFVASNAAAIVAHYEENKESFRIPASRKVRTLWLKVPEGADESTRRATIARLEKLRVEAISGADFTALVKAHSEHPTAAQGGGLGYVVRRQRPEAFKVPVGEVTAVGPARGGVQILKVEEELPPHYQDLTNPIRREIAAELLRGQGPQEAPLALSGRIGAAWREVPGGPGGSAASFDTVLREAHLRLGKSFPFSVDEPDDFFIPGIGKAPPVMRVIRSLTVDSPFASSPVLHRGQLYVLALKRKGKATRAGFSAAKDEFAEVDLAQRRRAALPGAWEALKREHGVELALEPVRDRYGVIRRKP